MNSCYRPFERVGLASCFRPGKKKRGDIARVGEGFFT